MGDNRNFAALEWVTGEIDETLKQARQSLEAYVENPNDSTRIRFCLTHIHQVHGSLQMVEFYGAALMAEEMENLAEAMMNERVNNLAEAQEVLMRAILQFPLYLDKVKSSRRDHPVMVLPLLNDLRTVRGESLLTETKLFTPNLAAARKIVGARLPQTLDNAQFLAMMAKLAKMYQYAAASVLRGVNVDENLAYLQKVFDRLYRLTQGTAKQSLWKIAVALTEGLANDTIEFSASIKNLLRQLNREIQILQKHGINALNVCASEELLKNLLYYVARAGEPAAERLISSQVYSDYVLADSMPEGGEMASAETENMVAGPDSETMRSVSAALKDELDSIKHLLDVSLSGIGGEDSVAQALPIMQRVGDTMAVLGIGSLRKQVLSQCEILEEAVNNNGSLSHDLLMTVASSIIEIENGLDAVAAGHIEYVDSDVSRVQINIDQAQASVLRESRNGLEHAKDAIIEYIASQWDRQHLESVPTTLREIRGGLDIIPLHRPAKILGACARYIEEQLLQQKSTPDWSTLDTLADAITSVEYYLERISVERRDEDEMLLAVAEESVESLGYAVASSTANDSKNVVADIPDFSEAELEVDSDGSDEATAKVSDDIGASSADSLASDVEAIDDFSEDWSTDSADTDSISAELEEPVVDASLQPIVEASADEEDAEEDEIDDEILEIFIEEAEEVTETIAEFFPLWAEDSNDKESLTEFRRAFHTLKGSGRMVGAEDIGDLAWSIENMLNRIIDGTVTVSKDHCTVIADTLKLLPDMIVAFRDRQPTPHKVLAERYIAMAEALAKGPLPAEFVIADNGSSDLDLSDANDEDEVDSLLWEIFGTEALGHLSVVEEFIAEMTQAAPLYASPSDDMQRALHTLKGSAHMAEVTPIAELATPLESLAKELRSYQLVIDEDILQLLRDGVTYTRAALAQIENDEVVNITQLPQFCARVAELRELHIAPLVRQKETAINGQLKIDPKLLEIFMAEEMNLLLDAEELLDDCLNSNSEDGSNGGVNLLQPLQQELQTLQLGATQANLPAIATLCDQLHSVYTATFAEQCDLNEENTKLLKLGHDQLLNMVDAVAAGQTLPLLDDELIGQLQGICSKASLVEDLDDSIDTADEAEAAEIESERIDISDLNIQELEFTEQESAPEVINDGEEISYSLPTSDQIEVDDNDINLLEVVIEDDDLGADFVADTFIDTALVENNEGSVGADLEEEISILADDTLVIDDLPLETSSVDSEGVLDLEGNDNFIVDVNAEADDEPILEAPSVDELPEGFDVELSEVVSSGSDDLDIYAEDLELIAPEYLESESAEAENLLLDSVEMDSVEVDSLEVDGLEVESTELSNTELEIPDLEISDLENSDLGDSGTDDAVNADLEVNHSDAEHLDFDALSGENTVTENAVSTDDINPPQDVDSSETLKVSEAVLSEGPSKSILADLNEDFDEEIIEIFLEEANELLEEMEHSIHDWESDWQNTEPTDELKRILHTLKGGARLAGMVQVGDLSHDFETMLINHTGDVDAQLIAETHSYQDKLLKSVEAIETLLAGGSPQELMVESDNDVDSAENEIVSNDPVDEDNISTDIESTVDKDEVTDVDVTPTSADIIPFAAKKTNTAASPSGPGSSGLVSASGGANTVAPHLAAQQLATKRSAPQEVVKVSAELLEELVNLAGETSITRGRMEEQVNQLGGAVDEMESTILRLQEQLRRLDIETEAQISFRQEQLSEQEEFDPLEMDRYSALQQLSRSLIESASDLMDLKSTLAEKTRDSETLLLQQSRINTELQEGLMRSRMVPFSRLVPRLRRIVRQVATELGKQVSFELDNVEGEMDRSVLERMVAPLEHMLRNAVDHGIEMPAERLAANKPETGRVVLSLSREGGDVLLRLVDDGHGINLERVRAKAIERGLMADNSALSDQDIMQFILHAGFSTADSVTQISGRGVGMDVVHSEIKQLGGAMLINSKQGQGTEFTVRLPFTVSVNRALMVQIGDDRYAIPLNTIEGIVRVSPFELEHYYQDDQARFEYAGENYHVRYLGSMLHSDAQPKLEDQVLPLPVVLVRSAEHTVAVQVDRLMGSREIVVKTLGPQFGSVLGLSGATVMGDGSVVVILDPHAMIRKEAMLAAASNSQLLQPLREIKPAVDSTLTVMVVDDSVTVRKVTGRFLEREGYNVITAKDGREALTVLQDHLPDVMLLDIEMPRMDGFEVAKNVRSSSRLKHIPIIMITSRTGDKHRLRAMELGVNKYMGKPFQEDILLGNIQALTGEADLD